jgi:3-isopropylmalate/(R)-2-methylmalate dehydratase small subunit
MQPFVRISGRAVPLMRPNIDTDAIIPPFELITTEKSGLGKGLFSRWRYLRGREPNPDFILNAPAYSGSIILVADENFGCGSSREHAVWSLIDYGFRCVIAPSFGDIFYGNSVKCGFLPAIVAPEDAGRIAACVSADPRQEITVDLVERAIIVDAQTRIPFRIGDESRQMLLEGLDEIALTQRLGAQIDDFVKRDVELRNWAWLDVTL